MELRCGVFFCQTYNNTFVQHLRRLLTKQMKHIEKLKKKTFYMQYTFVMSYLKVLLGFKKCLDLPVVTFLVYFMISIAALQPNMRGHLKGLVIPCYSF